MKNREKKQENVLRKRMNPPLAGAAGGR